ncbi:protein of unknown function [Nitrospira japonica]|uniref:Uncharacterized protein n=1 Tax=Nitrospira japonica TaxID=1325564 RepID=A0A1W1I8R7_9BACT|nr:hypothetical protein [Nitrospira japonica]SLM49412.1 protein of unknown function [Nitrospira japonica]
MDQESLIQIQRIIGAATESLRTDIAEAQRNTGALREELQLVADSLRTDIMESRRQTGILTEGLRHELQLVAESFQLHVSQFHAEERSHMDEQFRETRALVQLSYGQIQERVERLEHRFRTIEQHIGPLP